MNTKQQILTAVVLAAFILTLCVIPTLQTYTDIYQRTTTYAKTSPIWDIRGDESIRLDILFVEWGAIGVVYISLFFLLKDK